MTVNAETLKSLIERELEGVRDPRVVTHIRSLLVEPVVVLRHWNYGQPYEQYPCWTVLDDSRMSDTGIAYCEYGFGPRCPWGLVFIGDEQSRRTSIGMDSGWFPTFMEAFFDSFAATALPIWRVFSMDGGAPKEALTPELSWEEAWARCEAVRQSDRSLKYTVHHSIHYGS